MKSKIQIKYIVKLQDEIMEEECNCAVVNRRLNSIVLDHTYICCVRCCDCQWDRLIDGLKED
jgi:hypothetical protein